MCYVELLYSIQATCDRIHDCSLLATLFKIFTNDCYDRSGFICLFLSLSNKLSYCRFLDSNTA